MKSRSSRAETCLEQGESTAWLPPDRTGRPKERVRLDCERILRPERTEEKNQMGEAIRIAAPSSPHGQCGVLETGFGRDFRAADIEQTCRAGASPKPARNRLDSRTRVRKPSITGGTGSCGTPRTRKMTSAASLGESALEPMPTPCTPAFFISSSARAAWTIFARATSASEMG